MRKVIIKNLYATHDLFFSFVAEITLYSNEIIPTDAESFLFLIIQKIIEENEELKSLEKLKESLQVKSMKSKRI